MDKMSIITLVLFATVVCLLGAFIGYTIKGEASAQLSPPAVQDCNIKFYSMADNNTTIIVTKNTTFAILLEENPTTGYQWNASHTSGLCIVSDNYVPDDSNDSDRVGFGGLRVWVIKATGQGDQAFNAVYSRPWENATTYEGQFGMKVIIHDYDENGPVKP